ncbi:FAD/NAD(P)-binding protein [Bremerella sp. JC770]|uniref:FAD/NAD(P)-binding protein n=1 Tax=Bremerella sp. JC770 TaxID=3232137 RepID=UPI0034591184
MQTIAIIGGGFSGTLAAVNLTRFAKSPLRIVIVNSGRPFGRGTAYGTTRSEHLLNVAARNMSAFPDHPDHFVDWLRSRGDFDHLADDVLRETFIPRRIYGDYIRGLAAHYLGGADPRSQVKCHVMDDSAIDIEPCGQNGGMVHLQRGEPIEANAIVLATGNQPPAGLPGAAKLANDRRYCANPWKNWHEEIPGEDKHIVILGTGLTAIDVIVTLRAKGWSGKITAVSRHGILPQRHFRGIEWPTSIPNDGQKRNLAELLKLIRHDCERLRSASQNPAIAVDKLRSHTQQLWRDLSIEERKLFLTKYAADWNAIRHRIAGPIHDAVTDSLDCGQLTIVPAKIESLAAGETSIEVELAPGDQKQSTLIHGDYVINCTGPKSRFSDSQIPLYRNLFARGLAKPDEMDMGIAVTDDFAVINGDGAASNSLYAIGPILKGTLWETIAVPELRGQALAVSLGILDQKPIDWSKRDTIEYQI